MNIVFENMVIHNFMSYADAEFDWSAFPGINLITGINEDVPGSNNGCGKTNKFYALYYALYGELPVGVTKFNIMNSWSHSDGTYVTLYFRLDNRRYFVKQGIASNKAGSPICELYICNEDGSMSSISRSTPTATRKYIETQLIRTTKEMFMRTIFLNTDLKYNFFTLNESERIEFFERIFDLKYFSGMGKYFGDLVKKTKKTLAIEQTKLSEAIRRDDEYAEKNDEFEEHKKKLIKEAQEKFDAAKTAYDECNIRFSKIDVENIKRYDELLSKIEKKNIFFRDKMNDLVTKIRLDNNSIENNTSIITDKSKIIKKGKNLTAMLCTSCAKNVSDHFKLGEFEQEIQDKEISNKKLTTNIKVYENEIVSLRAEMDKWNKFYITKKDARNKLQSQWNSTLQELRTLERQLVQAQSELEHASCLNNSFSGLIESNKNYISEQQKKVDDISDDYNHMLYCDNLVSNSGIEKLAMERMVKALNREISNNLHALGSDYKVVMTSDMNYYFDNGAEGAHPQYENFSAGEKMRISIATCMAFKTFLSNRSGFFTNVLLVDEYVDSNVDTQAILAIFDMLKKQASLFNQSVFLVSHRAELKSQKFDNVIEIRKKNHFSTIKVV